MSGKATSAMTGRAERLRTFLETIGSGPVTWGVDDCSAAPVAWLKAETGIDVALPAYGSRAEALAVIASHGSLADTWSALAARHGIRERFDEPELGDIGVIDTRLYGQVGGIIAHGRIIYLRRDDGGWHALGAVRQFVKVFRVPCSD